MAKWLTANDAQLLQDLWPDVPMVDEVCNLYLNAAKSACLAYAPALPEPSVLVDGGYVVLEEEPSIPDEWVLAQVMQARNTYNAAKASPSGGFDGSGYGISAHPLDWQVKQLLRPERGVGAIL
jgi:hypothetical protein